MDIVRAQMDDIIDRETNDYDHGYRLWYSKLVIIEHHDSNDQNDNPNHCDNCIQWDENVLSRYKQNDEG